MWPKGKTIFNQATLNKLGSGLLDDNTYHISRLFIYSVEINANVKIVTPWAKIF